MRVTKTSSESLQLSLHHHLLFDYEESNCKFTDETTREKENYNISSTEREGDRTRLYREIGTSEEVWKNVNGCEDKEC